MGDNGRRAPLDRLTRHEALFILALARVGTIAGAARISGMCPNAGYQLMYRVRNRFALETPIGEVLDTLRQQVREAS